MKTYNDDPGMESISRAFVSRLYRFDCPSALEMADWESNLLDSSHANRIGQHVQHCPRCRQDLAEMRSFVSSMELPAPSMFKPLRKIIQAILAPSTSATLATVRGADDGTRFYQADNVEVTIQVENDPKAYGKRLLCGTIAVDGEAPPLGSEIYIGEAEAKTDDIGNFEINHLQPGSYDITVHLPEVDVQINDVTL